MLSLLLAAAWAADPAHVVLITLDTTRADALHCDGRVPDASEGQQPTTPNLCALADRGLRFTQFFAHAPTTLSSHASLFTGLDPHGHGIPRNGFPLSPEHPTLAERLGDSGWHTVAVIASHALEPAMGLDRGFAVYDADLSDDVGPVAQARADQVVSRALARVAERPADKPLFLWVHLFDPHAPYEAPEGYRDRYTDPAYDGPWRDDVRTPTRELNLGMEAGTADPRHQRYLTGRYLDEVAWTDAQIGRLLAGLDDSGVMDNTLVVVTADHGETLSEFPPFAWSHGSEVGNGAMRVPLILASTGPPLGPPGIVERQAAISGLAPTMEWALGLEPSLGTGHDFWDLVRPGPVRFQEGWPEGPVRPVFMEATRPRSHEPASGWNNLAFFRSLRAGGWAIHAAPMYELNPQFTPTDSPPHSAVLQTLTDSLGAWDAQAPTRREVTMTTETRAGLETLGYLEPEEE